VKGPARTTDIVPTIADAARVRIPWHVDGHSLLGPRPAEQNVILVKDKGKRFVLPVAQLEALREQALSRQLVLFGSGEPSSALFAVGPDRKLLGHSFEGRRRVADLDPIDLSGPLVQVSGHASGRSVALVARGRVVAVAPIAEGRFWALVPRAKLGGKPPTVYAVM
jgi:hypothetical protein